MKTGKADGPSEIVIEMISSAAKKIMKSIAKHASKAVFLQIGTFRIERKLHRFEIAGPSNEDH